MIHFVVALGAEAKPLIVYLKLNKVSSAKGFRLYQKESTYLVISGSGRVSAAAATAWLAAISPNPQGLWINIGTAGHGELEKGSFFTACKIQEAASQRSWFPPLIAKRPASLTLSSLLTVDVVQKVYEPIGYDMEASGFIATAHRFSHAEFVHVLKVVSDTPQDSSDVLQSADLVELMGSCLEPMNVYVQHLLALYQKTIDDIDTSTVATMIIKKWHFTSTQQHQLTTLLRQSSVLWPDQNVGELDYPECRSASGFLEKLRQKIYACVPAIGSKML